MSLIEIMRSKGPGLGWGDGLATESISVFETLIIFLFMGIPWKRKLTEEGIHYSIYLGRERDLNS